VLLTCQASKAILGRLLTAYLYILTKDMLAATTVQVLNSADCAIGGFYGAKIRLRTVGLRHRDESKDFDAHQTHHDWRLRTYYKNSEENSLGIFTMHHSCSPA